jgi:hypothetical protein
MSLLEMLEQDYIHSPFVEISATIQYLSQNLDAPSLTEKFHAAGFIVV